MAEAFDSKSKGCGFDSHYPDQNNADMVELVDTLDLDSSAERRESSSLSICTNNARVAKLVYALDLKSNDLGHTGSTPVSRTKKKESWMLSFSK